MPYQQSLELNRLVLLTSVLANAETWFTARALRLAAEAGIRGVVAYSDPVPRWRRDASGNWDEFHPGHVGVLYQAGGWEHLGRGTARSLVMLPDGSVLPDRAISKIRKSESGHAGAERRLVLLGAPPRQPGQPGAEWLPVALDAAGARRVAHPGNFRFCGRFQRVAAWLPKLPEQGAGRC